MTSLVNRRFAAIVFVASGLIANSVLADQQISAPQIVPTPLIAGSAQTAKVTATVSADPNLIPSSVNLVKRYPSGLVTVLGPMFDDGTHGDAVAGDDTYTGQVIISEAKAGQVEVAVTAAYSNQLLRASSPYTNVPVIAIVTITSPTNLAILGTNRVTVVGTVNDPTTFVEVNGVPVVMNGSDFSASIQLHEGNNSITAIASDYLGDQAATSIQVTADTTPPNVTIDTPENGAVVSAPRTTVTGLINDIVVGTVNGTEATVQVNGLPAAVANRTYSVTDVPLVPGTNTITAFATDRAGNSNSFSIKVFYNTSPANRIQIVSGNNQSGQIRQLLPLPLVVQATDTNGNPYVGKKVIFQVIQNDGLLLSGTNIANSLIVTSDVSGLAQVLFQLGTRAGLGNNQVSASIVGFQGMATFSASSSNSTPALVVLDTGNNQVGAIGQPLPKPFGVAVVDSGFNRLPNIPITFTITSGGGSFDGQTNLTVASDSNGRAVAFLTLGPDAGNDTNQVQANYAGNTGLPVTFVASAMVPGEPDQTGVSGVVLDNSDVPVPGATVRIVDFPTAVLSDANGYFQIKPAPVGAIRLIVDGVTVTRPGSWVWLQFDLVTIAGQDNSIGRPVRLMFKDTAHGMLVDATHGGTLTLPQVPGFSLTILPNSVLFPDGTRSGQVSVTVVHPDKMPDPPEFGQQPRFLVTIQPANALFNPPAPLCIPNLDGLQPGQKTEMYSYDHDMGQFVAIGTGTVSYDGSQICSDPGVGVLKAGWHCGGDPNQAGSSSSLGVSLSPKSIEKAVGEQFDLTASGTPPLDGTYTWEIIGTQPGDVLDAVEFTAQPSCADQQSCIATLSANKPGQVSVRVHFKCTTTGDEVTDDARITVDGVKLTIDGVADGDKQTVGGLVAMKSDNNNAPRKKIIVNKVNSSTFTGNLLLESSSDQISVFTASSGGTELTFNGTDNEFANSSIPAAGLQLWVEGEDYSDDMRDVSLTLTMEDDPNVEDQVTFTILWVDQPTVNLSPADTVSADNDKRDAYKGWTAANTYNLGLQLYNANFGARMGIGTEAGAVVHPADFNYPNNNLKLERDYEFHDLVGNTTITAQASFAATIPPGQDTGPATARDDNPAPNGNIYDWDAPGLGVPNAPQNEIHRTRNNFKAFASITLDGTAVRCSPVRSYFVRFSMKQVDAPNGANWVVIHPPDVANDNQGGNGTTALTWDLQ